MKFILKSLTFLTFMLLVISCSSDSASGGGNAPCVPITCLNGGVSTPTCGCTCPQGYSGANCSTQITPSKITITKIRITQFSNFTTTNSWWDILPNSYPDIFVALRDGSNTIYTHPSYYPDASSTGTNYYDFTPTTPINITSVNSLFHIDLYDYDGVVLGNELINTSTFFIYTQTTGFPSTLTVGTAPFKVELSLSYTW